MGKIFRSYQTELSVNNKQISKLKQHCGAKRWAFNFALARKKEAFDNNKEFKTKIKIPNNIELHRELNKLKGTEKLPWSKNISKWAFQEGLRDCDKAFDNFFHKCKQNIKGKKGFPKFKSKNDSQQSFTLGAIIKVSDESHIQVPKIGKLKLKEENYFPTNAKILSATISSYNNRWFLSLNVEEEYIPSLPKTQNTIGIDLGVKTLATCSDGTIYENPKILEKNLKKLKRKSRQHCKKKKGSKNREKSRIKLAKLHAKIANIRKDNLHKITSKIVSENQTIVLEDLNVKGMQNKNSSMARNVSDVGMYEFRRQIEYKAKWNNREIRIIDRWYPSSKKCCKCGEVKKELSLSERTFICECGNNICRDLNAAINIQNCQQYIVKQNTVSSTGIQACGEGSSLNENSVSLSMKQESNRKFKEYVF